MNKDRAINFLTKNEGSPLSITEVEVWAVSEKPYCINDLMPLVPLKKGEDDQDIHLNYYESYNYERSIERKK